jgi:hypothetical protein
VPNRSRISLQWAIPNAVSLTTHGGELEVFHGTPHKNWSVNVQIGATFDLEQIVEAHVCMEENKVVDRSYF